jgi:hypothetical protein
MVREKNKRGKKRESSASLSRADCHATRSKFRQGQGVESCTRHISSPGLIILSPQRYCRQCGVAPSQHTKGGLHRYYSSTACRYQ